MPSVMNCLYCCQLAMVIFAPAGSAPWLAVSLTHESISLRSVDCARPSEGKASNSPIANKRTKLPFIPVALRFGGYAPRPPDQQSARSRLTLQHFVPSSQSNEWRHTLNLFAL